MNFLNYSLAAVIAYLGLSAGFFLAVIAKEEMKAGKKYFVFLQKAILSLVFICLVIFLGLNYIVVLLLLACIGIYVSKNYMKKEFNDTAYTYVLLSVIFYLSSKKPDLFVIESSLIFLYGLPTGSLLMKKSRKETIVDILKNAGFVAVAMVLFLLL